MAKRRMQNSDYLFGADDDPMDLTGAFAPLKGPQSVEYDKDDKAIGLTQAFEPIPDQDEPRPWDEAGKWADFDWDAAGEKNAEGEGTPAAESPDAPDGPDAPEGSDSPHAPEGPEGKAEEASEGDFGQADATQGEPAAASVPASGAAHAAAASKTAPSGGSRRGRHAAPDPTMTPSMQRSRRTRRTLIVVVVLLVVVAGALGYYMFKTFSASQEEAERQAQEQVEEPEKSLASAPASDKNEITAQLTDVPVLTPVLGMTSDEAIGEIGHGAVVTSNRPVDEAGNPIKAELSVALSDEPVDSKTGEPTVYLGLDKDGRVIQVGYSASAAALGFGSLSFADAVESEHVVEKTLARIGVDVPEGSAALPENKDDYSTYGSDGSTVTRERCSFDGDVEVNGVSCTWSAVLSYDYTTQVVTGDLSDTVRIIYVYVTENAPAEEEPSAQAQAA